MLTSSRFFFLRSHFQSPKSTPGHRPLMHFASPLFETHPALIQLKSMLLDFFNGHSLEHVHLAGLEHVISITCGPPPPPAADNGEPSSSTVSEASTLPTIHFRTSTIRLLNSGTRVPRMELEPMGPNFDFKVRRREEADPDVLKQALRRPKVAKKDVEKGLGKKRKNIETDDMGDKVGRIHLGKQELGKLQVRKMKGLRKFKVDKDADKSDADKSDAGGESEGGGDAPTNRRKKPKATKA